MLSRRCVLLALLPAALATPARAQGYASRSPLARDYDFSDDEIEGTLVVPTAPVPATKPARRCPKGSVEVVATEQSVHVQQAVPVQAPLYPSQQAAASERDIDTSAETPTVCVPGEMPADDVHAFAGDGLFRPPIEWSTWFRASYGFASHRSSPLANIARSIEPVPAGTERGGTWDFGLGIEASLSASKHGDVRLGGWLEQRGLSANDTFAGAELVVTRAPKRLDLFLYEGHGIAALRVGRSTTAATAAIAWGYMAPYWLEGACRERFFGIQTGVCHPRPQRLARYIAGVRVVGTFTRAIDNPHEWSATLGLEFEPIGALRANLGIRSWYRN